MSQVIVVHNAANISTGRTVQFVFTAAAAQFFQFVFYSVRQFEALVVEELNAVVGEFVVRS